MSGSVANALLTLLLCKSKLPNLLKTTANFVGQFAFVDLHAGNKIRLIVLPITLLSRVLTIAFKANQYSTVH